MENSFGRVKRVCQGWLEYGEIEERDLKARRVDFPLVCSHPNEIINVGLRTWNTAVGTRFGWIHTDAQSGGYDAFATKYLTTAFFDLY